MHMTPKANTQTDSQRCGLTFLSRIVAGMLRATYATKYITRAVLNSLFFRFRSVVKLKIFAFATLTL